MMKESIYNYKINLSIKDEYKSFIFNTRSRKLLDFTGQQLSNLSPTQEKILRNNGFLVDDDIDESQLALYYRINKIYQNKLLSLTIIPTADCNFKCVYCYQTSKNAYIDREVVENIIKYIEKNVQYYSALSITWFGGEPLLCKDEVLYIIKKAKNLCLKHNKPFVSYMTTNGYELDLNFFTKSLKNGLRYYQITIDGDSNIHNLQRPHILHSDSFERIIDNLSLISKNTDKLRFEIGIRINVSKKSLATMPVFIEKLSELFAADKRFVLIWQWVRDWGGDRIDKGLTISNTVCKDLMKISMEKGMRCYEVLSCNSGTDICEAAYKNGYVINYVGKVYKCAMKTFDNPEEDMNCIGELNNRGDIEIDEIKEAKWLLPKIRDDCYACVFFPMCMGNACPFTSVYKNKQTCIVFKSLIPTQIESMYARQNFISLQEDS